MRTNGFSGGLEVFKHFLTILGFFSDFNTQALPRKCGGILADLRSNLTKMGENGQITQEFPENHPKSDYELVMLPHNVTFLIIHSYICFM